MKRSLADNSGANEVARHFYARHGAEHLEPHWMVWMDIRRAVEVQHRQTRVPQKQTEQGV